MERLLERVNSRLCVCNEQILNVGQTAQTLYNSRYLEAGLLELGLPGAVLLSLIHI